jgi:hypothetical protein
MKKYIIEREVPNVGALAPEEMRQVAVKSNDALSQLAPHVQWLESFVAPNKTFCIYLAEDESYIQRHAELSGIPANEVTEISQIIDPTTASSCS